MQQTFDIRSMEALIAAVEVIHAGLTHPPDRAVVLGLSGELGTGKTTFVQTLARKLGVTDVVTSPTFGIMKSYRTTDSQFQTLIHIDAYRVEEIDEMRVLHFDEMLTSHHTLMCIEWYTHIEELIPPDAHLLAFTLEGDSRTLTYTTPDNLDTV